MEISRVSAYVVDVPFVEEEGAKLSGGREFYEEPTIIVSIETNVGLIGWGETQPWGSVYLPAFAGGVIPGLEEIVPHLMGEDPRGIWRINQIMDGALLGHPYVKSAIDMACWDLLGKACNLPLYQLFGGMITAKPPLQAFLPRTTGEKLLNRWETLRGYGFSHFCTKLMGEYGRDLTYIKYIGEHMKLGESLIFDVNRGFRLDEAIMIANMSAGIALCLEQPCETIEECMEVGKRTGIPIMLDECVLNLNDFMRAYALGPFDSLNLKLARFGGITKSLQIRDLCLELKIPLFLQDVGGTGIAAAAVAHMAHATPERFLLGVWIGYDEFSLQTVEEKLEVEQRRCWTTDAPGLGVTPILEVLGEPKAVWS